jgi:class 3 adenylate cyclase/tetratricopeptide (TPR) repeat protein
VERKLATVIFVDLVESTALVSESDPEVVRRRVSRFFDGVSECIAKHGGTVEKFAGDAVMAAFGIPVAHEDDAERAVRAGLAILDQVRELELEARIGVESGEVVADDSDSTFATGVAVNVAARLQQVAEPGQILIGPGAYRLTLGRVVTEDVGPVDLRGRGAPIWVWRAVATLDGAARKTGLEAPLVGRDAELELLENTFERARRDRRAHLFTIYGDPGVGKSRLAREFVAGLEGATVLSGRCLPYGEGITYWPLAEMVKAAAGIADDDPAEEALEKLRATCEIEAVADLLGLASGILAAVEGERSQEELAWAARAWAQRLAEVQPVVLVFEDIHWGEEPLLRLIEHLAAWVRDAPVLLLCLARPELLDVHPGWGGGRVRATAIELEPLPPAESEQLASALLAEHDLSAEARELLLEKTEGNPLFVEETIRMLLEEAKSGDGAAAARRIPDTLQALIGARIDRLPQDEKALLQRASVIGRVFWAGAVAELAPDLDDLPALLDDLVLREFLLEEPRSTISDERAYRFKHVLIREVAYAGLSKSSRSGHHERFAGWLKAHAGEELLEIRAYHLEQACRLTYELEGVCPPEIEEEAGAALEQAAKRALAREAYMTARKLALRSVELRPTLRRRYLAARAAWRLGDLPAVAAEMEQVRVKAAERGEHRIHALALTALGEVALYQETDVERATALIERALEVLGDEADPAAHFDALHARAAVSSFVGNHDEELQFTEQALVLATAAGRKDLETLAAQNLASCYLLSLELDRAALLLERASGLAEESGSIRARANVLSSMGFLAHLRGDLDGAERAQEEARELSSEIGSTHGLAHALKSLGRLAADRGELVRAEKLLRESIRLLVAVRDRGYLCESQRALAQVLAEQGRLDDAERLALEARETVGPGDKFSVTTTTLALGVVRAAQGRDTEAEELLREALAAAERDSKFAQLEPLTTLARFLRDRGRDHEAAVLEARRVALLPSSAAAESSARIA